jgi:hypothetical protein
VAPVKIVATDERRRMRSVHGVSHGGSGRLTRVLDDDERTRFALRDPVRLDMATLKLHLSARSRHP